jgi:TPR repeat protein
MLVLTLTVVLAAAPAAEGCEAKGVDACRAACNAKQGAACFMLGNLLRAEAGDTAVLEAMTALDSACKLNVASGCATLGTWLLEDPDDGQRATRAAELLRKACDRGDALGCSNYGAVLEHGIGVKEDPAASTHAYEKACRLKDPVACSSAGIAYLKGHGVAVDEPRGMKLSEQACAMGSTNACVTVAALDRFGRGGHKRDPKKAATVFEQACADQRDPVACGSLADMVRTGEGVPRDPARAAQLRKLSCKLGVADECDGN